jgi:rhamnogalacturonyl hydrolase YesR
MKRIFFFLITLMILFGANAQPVQVSFKPKDVLTIMEKVADWQLNDWQKNGFKYPKWDWVNAAGFAGLQALSTVSKKNMYEKFLLQIGNDCGWETGPRRLFADDYCIGQLYALLYMKYKNPKMIANFQRQADSIVNLPHDESLEWKDGVRFREWAWCDALFMAPPALCFLTTATGDERYLNISNSLWWKTTDYLYDTTEHLYTRDGSYLNRKEKNGKKVFWARGNGWVMAGLARVRKSSE